MDRPNSPVEVDRRTDTSESLRLANERESRTATQEKSYIGSKLSAKYAALTSH